jgi:hypothetical protein
VKLNRNIKTRGIKSIFKFKLIYSFFKIVKTSVIKIRNGGIKGRTVLKRGKGLPRNNGIRNKKIMDE